MQQPKLFYPPHETYAPDGQPSRAFPTFVLPENLASVGTPSLYHPPSQDLCATPPAGFHMAPCGCFFDPRIYRIEWATANFLQPSVYKVSSGPGPPSTYLLDSQKYLKGPVQPLPYSPYQPVAGNTPFALPFFKPEGSPAKGTEHLGFVASVAHGPQFMEVSRLPGENLLHVEDRPLLPGVPSSLGLKEQQPSQGPPYQPLEPSPGLAFPAFKPFPAEEGDFQSSHDAAALDIEEPPLAPEDLDAPGAPQVAGELEPCGSLESVLPDPPLPEEAFQLPDQVLLEDAMKLFDCSPVNSDAEASLDSGQSTCPGGSGPETCFSGEDSSSDIRSLHLPDELLSFDYSVPEILSTVTSLDYLYEVEPLGEEAPWGSRPPSHHQPPLEPERRKSPALAARKSKPAASKPKLAPSQGSEGGSPEPDPALLAL